MGLGMLGAPIGSKNRPAGGVGSGGGGGSNAQRDDESGATGWKARLGRFGLGLQASGGRVEHGATNMLTGGGFNRLVQQAAQGAGFVPPMQQSAQQRQPVMPGQASNWWGGGTLHGGAQQTAPGVQSTPQNNLLNQFDAWMRQQQSGLSQQYGTDLAYANTVTGMNQDILRRGLGVDLGLLGERRYRDVDLAGEKNAVDKWRNDVDLNLIGQQMGLRREQFDSDNQYIEAVQGLLNERRGTAGDRFNTNDAFLQQQARDTLAQYGFNNRSFQLDQQGNMLQRDTNRRAASSDAAGRGAFGSSGFRDNIGDIAKQFGISQEEAKLAFDKANQSVDEQGRVIGNNRDNLGFGYRDQITGFNQEQAGLDRNRRDTSIGYRGDLLGFEGRKADNTARRKDLELVDKGLASLAREYGIKEGDLRAGFGEAVTKLGLDLHQTELQLQRMLNSGNADLAAQATNFMSQMMAYA